MADIIRQDIIQVNFDIDDSPLRNAEKRLNSLQGEVKDVDKGSFKGFVSNAKKATQSIKGLSTDTKNAHKGVKELAKTSLNNLAKGAKTVATQLGNVAKKAGTSVKNLAKTSFTKLQNGLKKIKTHLSDIATTAGGKTFSALKKIAGLSFKALAGGLVAAGAATFKFATMASDLEETKNKIDVAFGAGDGAFSGASKTVMEWSKKSTTSMGLAQQTALDTAALFGDMGTSMGLTKDAAADMSMALTQQAADIASFKNLNIDEATTALNGIFTGETESLKRLGVVMTETNLERYAQEKGITKSLKSMSEAEKVQLRYNYVMEKTKNATGDYARTGGGFANQLRTLTENFKQLGTVIGKMPMTKLASGMKVINDDLAKIQTILEDGFQEGDTDKIMNIVNGWIDKGVEALSKGLPKLMPVVLSTLSTVANSLVKAIPKVAPVLAKGVVDLMIGLGKIIWDNRQELITAAKDVVVAVGKAIYEGFTGNTFEGVNINAKALLAGGAGIFGVLAAVKGLPLLISKMPLFSKLFGGKKKGGKNNFLANIGKQFEKLGKSKPGMIAKGVANLSIIVGGVAALTAVVAGVGVLISKISNAKDMLITVGLIGAVGLVGAGLAKLSGIVGKIPVSSVLLGLANMGIMIAGVSALVLLVGATTLINFDLNKIMQTTKIIGLLGTTGAALSLFAGVVGLIPMPVVLSGLANMALAIGGVTALILAYGKLSQIKGFNEFIAKGGNTLSQIFNVIGKIGGSLIGGLGEGIANSLPKIGENISAFATSLKPMFTMFNGVDVGGVGTFFKAIGSFMLQMSGNKLLDFFTGGPDFSGVVKGLKALASEDTKKFFTMVNSIETGAFEKGKQFFDCLDKIGSLPNTGGIGQWFSGKNDYSGVAKGLGKLSGENVKNFFTMVQGLETTAFDNAKSFFEALDGIGSLPNAGGIAQWFSGKNDFSGVAKGLAAFATDGVKEFFTMVNGLDIGKLNGLWKSLGDAGKLTTENLSGVMGKSIDTLVTKISELPKKMGDALKNNSKGLSDGFVSMWTDAVKATVAPVNKLLSGANHILKEFGSSKKVIEWTPYAKGTSGHRGGNALVNDGRGAELVQMPNGKMFIPQGRNVFMPNAPKGMKVLSAENTARLMGRNSPTYKYADGTGDIDIWSFIDNPSGLANKIANSVSYKGMSGFVLNAGKGIVTTFTGAMSAWIEKLFKEEGALGLGDYVAGKGVGQWRTTVIRALKMEGLYSVANVARTLFQMQTESGGNPRAINLWDSNAKKGIPSKGLMQVIDPTFNAYARSGFNKNIYDPLSNILASVRYAKSRYGTLAKAFRGKGYENGGIANTPSIFGEKGAEMAIPLSVRKRSRAVDLWAQTGEILGLYNADKGNGTSGGGKVEYNTYAPVFEINVTGGGDARTTARSIKKAVKEALQEMAESIDRRTPSLQEV